MTKRNDNYQTPQYLANWAVEYALDQIAYNGEGFSLLEPGCGAKTPFANVGSDNRGHVIAIENRIVSNCSNPTKWESGCKLFYQNIDFLNPEEVEKVLSKGHIKGHKSFDIIATNPPFSKAEEFIWESFKYLKPMGIMIFLLKLPFLSSLKRRRLFSERPPHEVWVLQRRPSFSYDGKTDITEYAFYVWFGEARSKLLKMHNNNTLLKWLDNKNLEKQYIKENDHE